MKKIITFFIVLFWSMIFPSLSFNSFTTDIIDNSVHYTDMFDSKLKSEILKGAKFDFWLSHLY